MKKFLVFVLIISMVLCFGGCGKTQHSGTDGTNSGTKGDKIHIVRGDLSIKIPAGFQKDTDGDAFKENDEEELIAYIIASDDTYSEVTEDMVLSYALDGLDEDNGYYDVSEVEKTTFQGEEQEINAYHLTYSSDEIFNGSYDISTYLIPTKKHIYTIHILYASGMEMDDGSVLQGTSIKNYDSSFEIPLTAEEPVDIEEEEDKPSSVIDDNASSLKYVDGTVQMLDLGGSEELNVCVFTEYTNHSGESCDASSEFSVDAFQNGVEITPVLHDGLVYDGYVTRWAKVQDGVTGKVLWTFRPNDESPVTIEMSNGETYTIEY